MVEFSSRFVGGTVLGIFALLVISLRPTGAQAQVPAAPDGPAGPSVVEAGRSAPSPDSLSDDHSIDLRHAPPRWKTLLSFPGDRQKTLVNERGALAYDFGPGPYAQPMTTVEVGVEGDTLQRTDQQLLEPRVPVVITEHQSEAVHLRQEAFSVVLDSARIPSPPSDSLRVHRRNGRTRTLGWADPKSRADPAFRHVAWGSNRPIRYRIDVEPNSRKRLALGFCDSYREPGRVLRLMELQVDGAETKTINVAEEGGKNVPQVVFFDAADTDGDGQLAVEVAASPRTEDPNVFVNALWMFGPGTSVSEEAVIRGAATDRAEVHVDSGREPERRRLPPRVDAIRAEVERGEVAPVVRIKSRREFSFDESSGVLQTDGRPFVVTRPAAIDARRTESGWTLELPTGTETANVLVVRGHRRPRDLAQVPNLVEARDAAVAYWRNLDLPWDRIRVPDAEMQAFLDASIRTVYQLREPVDGVPQFQPGATVYRGLWAAHLPRVGRAVTTLGDTAAARQSLEQLFRHQEANGQIVILTPPTLLKETGTTLKALVHQAKLAGDKAWLADQWSHVERAVDWIRKAREQAPDDPSAPNYGLMPAALSDGGVGGVVPEYTTVHWSLIGLRSALEAARWLGKTKQALDWQAAYADFWGAYRKGIARDARRDEHGNLFLPIRMNYDPDEHVPQRSQVNVCHMIYPGRLYEKSDPLVDGTLGMLRDAESAQGLPVSIGWLDGGVWAEVGFTCAQAHLWSGNVEHAQDLLYTATNHAAPTRVWVEEQMPGGSASRTGGDVPHGNASSEFINLLRTLFVMEEEDALTLLRGMPSSWIEPGSELKLKEVNTTFGPLSLTLTVSDDGQQGTLVVEPVGEAGTDGGPVVHLQALKEAGYVGTDGEPLPDRWAGTWGEQIEISFRKGRQ